MKKTLIAKLGLAIIITSLLATPLVYARSFPVKGINVSPQVTPLPPADLKITNVRVSPSDPTVNDQLQFEIDIRNYGETAAQNFTVAAADQDQGWGNSTFVRLLNAGTQKTARIYLYAGPESVGEHTFKFTVDSGNTVSESNENNNNNWLVFEIKPDLSAEAKPDLSLSKPLQITPENPKYGDEITFSINVSNIGDADITDRFRVTVQDQTAWAGHQDLYYLAAHSSKTVEITLDSSPFSQEKIIENNPHAFKITVDSTEKITESNEDNNEYTSYVTFQELKKADLYINSIKVTPENPQAGDFIDLEITLGNAGEQNANNVAVLLEESSYGQTEVTHIDLESNSTKITSLQLPVDQAGIYHYTATVDYNHQIEESNEDNNQKTIEVKVAPKELADLTIKDVTFTPANPTYDDIVTFKVKIKNEGQNSASNFNVKVDDLTLKEVGQEWSRSQKVGYDLMPSQEAEIRLYLIPSQLPGKPLMLHQFLFEIDSENTVKESNEENNQYGPVEVEFPKDTDLDIATVRYDDYVDLAKTDTLSFEIIISNLGDLPAGESFLTLLDQNGWGTAVKVGKIAGNYKEKIVVTLDPNSIENKKALLGDHYFTINADAFHNVAESNERNNEYKVKMTIVDSAS